MNKCIYSILLVLLSCSLAAQERGLIVKPYSGTLHSPLKGDSGKRKAALIVGVSDYSSNKLNLKYASKDARLFYSYLTDVRSFPKENIFILHDSLASSGKIYNSIHDLMKWLVAGDELILYFAGHGDVQTVADFDEGFFLAWDASDSRNYYGAAGTLKLSDLELYTNRLATQKKVTVNLVMDACHSGFSLHQDGILKARENISGSFTKVNRFLGCAVNEFSYEADSVGHGLFTWYLLQGMMGLADEPADNKVTTAELNSWVKNRVSAATRGKQNPVITAPEGVEWTLPVTTENKAKAFAYFRNKKYDGYLASRGQGENDTSGFTGLQRTIDTYNRFLLQQKFYGNDSSCLQVILELETNKDPKAAELQAGLRNHLAEMLETRSQLVLNEYLGGKSVLPPPAIYYTAATDAQIADSLLPAGDPRKKNNQVMSAFHKAFGSIRYEQFEKYPAAEQLLRQAIALEDRAAYLYLTLSYVLSYQHQYDSAIWYARKAERMIPTWSHPKNVLGNLYHDIFQYEKALQFHRDVLKLDSSYAWSYNNIGLSMLDMGRLKEAEYYFSRSLEMKKNSGHERYARDWAISYSNLGVIAKEREMYPLADSLFAMADSLDPTLTNTLRQWSELSAGTDGAKAESLLLRAIQQQPHEAENYYALAEFYRLHQSGNHPVKEMDSLYRIAIRINPLNEEYYAGIGFLLLDEKKTDSARYWFSKGFTISGGSAAAWGNLGYYYKFAEQPDSAIAAFQRSLSLNPWDIGLADELAGFLLLKKDSLGAEKVLLNLCPLQPNTPSLYYQLGNFYYRTGQWNKAIQQYETCLQTDSAYINARIALALVHLENGNKKSSLQYMKHLLQQDPQAELLISYLHAVSRKACSLPVSKRLSWLQDFTTAFPESTILGEVRAEAAYLSGQSLQKVFNEVRAAELKSEFINSTLVRWLFLLSVELNQTVFMKELAGRYLDEVLNTEPEIQAVALAVMGKHKEARQVKAGLKLLQPEKFRRLFNNRLAAI